MIVDWTNVGRKCISSTHHYDKLHPMQMAEITSEVKTIEISWEKHSHNSHFYSVCIYFCFLIYHLVLLHRFVACFRIDRDVNAIFIYHLKCFSIDIFSYPHSILRVIFLRFGQIHKFFNLKFIAEQLYANWFGWPMQITMRCCCCFWWWWWKTIFTFQLNSIHMVFF